VKVYGLMVMRGRKQVRAVVAAKSQKDAVAAFAAVGLRSVTLHHFRQYASETGNKAELAVATEPGVVWWTEDRYKPDPHYQPWGA
jgi:hypothetical protein